LSYWRLVPCCFEACLTGGWFLVVLKLVLLEAGSLVVLRLVLLEAGSLLF